MDPVHRRSVVSGYPLLAEPESLELHFYFSMHLSKYFSLNLYVGFFLCQK